MGVVEPWDTSLITNFADLEARSSPAARSTGSSTSSRPTGGSPPRSTARTRSSPTARSRGRSSTTSRYKGKISWWDSPLENFVIWGYVERHRGPVGHGPTSSSTRRATSSSRRSTSAGTSGLPRLTSTPTSRRGTSGSRTRGRAPTPPRRNAELDVVYSEPKEGRLGWNCGFVAHEGHRELPPRARVRRSLGRASSRRSGSSTTTRTGTLTPPSTLQGPRRITSRSSTSTTRRRARSQTRTTRARSRRAPGRYARAGTR